MSLDLDTHTLLRSEVFISNYFDNNIVMKLMAHTVSYHYRASIKEQITNSLNSENYRSGEK